MVVGIDFIFACSLQLDIYRFLSVTVRVIACSLLPTLLILVWDCVSGCGGSTRVRQSWWWMNLGFTLRWWHYLLQKTLKLHKASLSTQEDHYRKVPFPLRDQWLKLGCNFWCETGYTNYKNERCKAIPLRCSFDCQTCAHSLKSLERNRNYLSVQNPHLCDLHKLKHAIEMSGGGALC